MFQNLDLDFRTELGIRNAFREGFLTTLTLGNNREILENAAIGNTCSTESNAYFETPSSMTTSLNSLEAFMRVVLPIIGEQELSKVLSEQGIDMRAVHVSLDRLNVRLDNTLIRLEQAYTFWFVK